MKSEGFMEMYIVEIEEGVWLAPWRGDPGRTSIKKEAKLFGSHHGARVALGFARRYRPFAKAKIVKI